jgi:hypothetical protein
MKTEDEPISDDEWLLRRVRIERFQNNREPLISPNAFEPRISGREPDSDGISLYRNACLSSPEEILSSLPVEKRGENGNVRISAGFVRSLGLSVRSMPADGIPGHVVILELNATAYSADKSRFIAIKRELAVEASRAENIVHFPAVRPSAGS